MNIIIAGPGKTGTSALFFALKKAMPWRSKCFFEPFSIKKTVDALTQRDNILFKYIIGIKLRLTPKDAEYIREFFTKRIFIVRDPRDCMVSRGLYRVRDMRFIFDPELRRRYIDHIEAKEKNPASVPFKSIFELQDELEAKAFEKAAPDWPPMVQSKTVISYCDASIEFWETYGKDFFMLRYEDFVRGAIAELEDYVGLRLNTRVSVDNKFRRVERTKGSGDWKRWFTPEDEAFFRPYCDKYMEAFGYPDDWESTPPEALSPDTGSKYVRNIIKMRLEGTG